MPDKTMMTATSGKALRESRAKLVQFNSSGEWYRLKRPSMLELASDPDLPDFLTQIIQSSIEKKKAESLDIGKLVRDGRLGDVKRALDLICKKAFIEPHIVDDPEADDEIGIDDLTDDEKMECFQRVMGRDGLAAAGFPPASLGSMGSVPAVQDIPVAEPSAGNGD